MGGPASKGGEKFNPFSLCLGLSAGRQHESTGKTQLEATSDLRGEDFNKFKYILYV